MPWPGPRERYVGGCVGGQRREVKKSERNSKTILKMHDHELYGDWPGSACRCLCDNISSLLSSYKHSIALIYRSYTLNSWALLPSLLCCSFMYSVLIWCFCCFIFFSGASRMMSYYCNVCEDLRRETASVAWLYDPQTIFFFRRTDWS